MNRIRNGKAAPFADTLEDLAEKTEQFGAEETEFNVTYETPDCEDGDLGPSITLRVKRVNRTDDIKCSGTSA